MRYLFMVFVLTVAACATPNILREQTAMRYASAAWMVPRVINAGPFTLKAYERMHQRHAPAHVYIEGDGLMFKAGSYDPTPENPVALHMATKDKAQNVVYLARPCQFESGQNKACQSDQFWTHAKFSSTVIAAYQDALDNVKALYNIEGFHIIGHGGGGVIAAILAAERNDVLSLRTVAGMLDHSVYTSYYERAPLSQSLNPADYVEKLRDMPQRHYIGAQDDMMPPAVLESYLQKIEPSRCVSYLMVQENEHWNGWVEKWPELLADPLYCVPRPRTPAPPMFFEREPEPFVQPRVMDMDKGSLK